MSRSLLTLSLLLFSVTGCNERGAAATESDDDAAEKKTTKKKTTKKKNEESAEREVFPDCSKAKGLGYLEASKTSEAKNTIGAIARGAAAAYEREHVSEAVDDEAATHKLCASATPVPADGPPKGRKYQPNHDEGADYNAGDPRTGWPCLKFLMTQPQYYQYGYNAGSGYKSTAFGLPDPGPDGFEAWAMGDLDGDGKPSLFVRTGTVDKATQTLKMSTVIGCVDPGE